MKKVSCNNHTKHQNNKSRAQPQQQRQQQQQHERNRNFNWFANEKRVLISWIFVGLLDEVSESHNEHIATEHVFNHSAKIRRGIQSEEIYATFSNTSQKCWFETISFVFPCRASPIVRSKSIFPPKMPFYNSVYHLWLLFLHS